MLSIFFISKKTRGTCRKRFNCDSIAKTIARYKRHLKRILISVDYCLWFPILTVFSMMWSANHINNNFIAFTFMLRRIFCSWAKSKYLSIFYFFFSFCGPQNPPNDKFLLFLWLNNVFKYFIIDSTYLNKNWWSSLNFETQEISSAPKNTFLYCLLLTTCCGLHCFHLAIDLQFP